MRTTSRLTALAVTTTLLVAPLSVAAQAVAPLASHAAAVSIQDAGPAVAINGQVWNGDQLAVSGTAGDTVRVAVGSSVEDPATVLAARGVDVVLDDAGTGTVVLPNWSGGGTVVAQATSPGGGTSPVSSVTASFTGHTRPVAILKDRNRLIREGDLYAFHGGNPTDLTPQLAVTIDGTEKTVGTWGGSTSFTRGSLDAPVAAFYDVAVSRTGILTVALKTGLDNPWDAPYQFDVPYTATLSYNGQPATTAAGVVHVTAEELAPIEFDVHDVTLTRSVAALSRGGAVINLFGYDVGDFLRGTPRLELGKSQNGWAQWLKLERYDERHPGRVRITLAQNAPVDALPEGPLTLPFRVHSSTTLGKDVVSGWQTLTVNVTGPFAARLKARTDTIKVDTARLAAGQRVELPILANDTIENLAGRPFIAISTTHSAWYKIRVRDGRVFLRVHPRSVRGMGQITFQYRLVGHDTARRVATPWTRVTLRR